MGGLASGKSDFFVVFGILTAVFLSAILGNVWAARKLRWKQSLSSGAIMAGTSARLHLELIGKKWFFSLLKVNIDTGQDEDVQALIPWLPGASNHVDLSIEYPYRGKYMVGVKSIEVQDVFGLHRVVLLGQKRGEDLLSLMVCPRIFPAVLPEQLASSPTGRDAINDARPADAGDSFSAPRSYQPGDSLKRIHWKLSAKTRELYTRQYEIAVERHVLLILDNQDYGLAPEESLAYGEAACQLACSIASRLAESGKSVKVMAGSGAYQWCTGANAFPQAYQWLACLPFDGKQSVKDVLREEAAEEKRPGMVYAITAWADSESMANLSLLSSLGCRAVCLEVQIPGMERPKSQMRPGVKLVPVAMDGVPQALRKSL
nr:DUF58 domain-containing protein [uncultured Solibaculum sp.]